MKEMEYLDRYDEKHAGSAVFFRRLGLLIDADPSMISSYLSHPMMLELINIHLLPTIDKVKWYESLSYGDAGVLLATPGASLAGMLVDEVATPTQQSYFHHIVDSERTQTFFAVTEPGCGSNLSCLATHVKKHEASWIVSGEKYLVGHAATASIGVLISRLSPGPLGLIAVMVTPEMLKKNYSDEMSCLARKELPMIGLRGARLGQLFIANLKINEEHLLGLHVNPAKRGMMALIKTFNKMRPCVAAMAIGVSQAMIDYVHISQASIFPHVIKRLTALEQRIKVARQMIHHAAKQMDDMPLDSGPSSLAKAESTRVAELVAEQCKILLGKYAFIEHPWFEKSYRDVFGFEYMEGTRVMQQLNVFHAYEKNQSKRRSACLYPLR